MLPGASEGTEEAGLAMCLTTPDKILTFQKKLYEKAKGEPALQEKYAELARIIPKSVRRDGCSPHYAGILRAAPVSLS